MSTILVLLEHTNGSLPKSALVVLAAAREARASHGYSKIAAVVIGSDDSGVAAAGERARVCEIDEVIVVKGASCHPYLALNAMAALKPVLGELGPTMVLLAATTLGKDLAPRIAHHLDAGQVSEIIGILPAGRFRRLMYAGNIVSEVEVTTPVKVGTVRTTAFEPVKPGAAPCPLRTVEVGGAGDPRTRYVSFEAVKSERPELSEAEIVVSGGRALKSAENFTQYIIPLADALNAAVGASRAAVDSGYAPNDWQVGQTGKVVAPSLYIAVGISGAIQHLAGMKDSKVIVAINKDAEAPIFEVADYALVADLFESVPKLTEAIRAAKNT